MSALPRLLVAGAACLWGMWSLCFRAVEAIAPVSAAVESLVVFTFMLVLLAPFAWRARGAGRSRRAWVLIVAMGVVDGCNALCFFSALQRTTVALAVLTHYIAPVLVALAAPLIVGERYRARTFAALALASAGLVLLLQPWSVASSAGLVGPALGALSAVFFAATVLLAKVLGSESPRFSTMELGFVPKAPAMAVLAIAVLVQGDAGAVASLTPAQLLLLLGGALAFGAVPLIVFYVGLAQTPVSQASVLTLCEPLVAVIVGAVAFGELPGPLALVGALLVVAGAAVIATAPAAAPSTSPSVSPSSAEVGEDQQRVRNAGLDRGG